MRSSLSIFARHLFRLFVGRMCCVRSSFVLLIFGIHQARVSCPVRATNGANNNNNIVAAAAAVEPDFNITLHFKKKVFSADWHVMSALTVFDFPFFAVTFRSSHCGIKSRALQYIVRAPSAFCRCFCYVSVVLVPVAFFFLYRAIRTIDSLVSSLCTCGQFSRACVRMAASVQITY